MPQPLKLWSYVLTLACGHRVTREQYGKHPVPKRGQETLCAVCRTQQAIKQVQSLGSR